MKLLGWCKSNCIFALLNFVIWYWNTFLNKCGYIIHHFTVHFLLYVLFVNDLLLVIYYIYIIYLYIFILDCGNVRQKANLSSFLIQVQTSCKAVATTCNISSTFGPGTANKHAVRGSRRRREPWRWGARPAVRRWQWPTEGHLLADFLTTAQEVAEELNIDRSMVIWH